jgi:ribosomal protein S6--L-glutamate ligase
MEKFKSFITEAKEKKYSILVISSETSPGKKPLHHTARRFVDEVKPAGHNIYIVQVEGAIITYDNGYKIFNADDKDGFEITNDTVAIVRGSVRLKKSYLDLLSQLEKIGVCMVNNRETVEISSDKYRTYLKLQDYGLTQPKTVLIPNEDTWKQALESLDSKFPIIMKTLEGAKGVGVLFIESERQIESLVQLLYNQNENVDLLIQEYIKTDGDIRVIVLGGKIIASMKREVIKGDFRSNVSQGAKVKKYKLSDKEITICLSADKAVNGVWTAVDFIKNGKDIFVLEVNSSPGTKGIEEATGKNIIKEILQHFKNKNTWRYSALEVGWEEIVTVNPFGELIAKFDTGNSIKSVIHAEDVKVNGKKITFTLNGKTITTKLVGNYTSVTGAGEDDRYIVELEFEFAGTNYGKVQFGLDDRSRMGTDVLLNRDLMNRLNVMVNPQRTYVVTTPYTLDK